MAPCEERVQQNSYLIAFFADGSQNLTLLVGGIFEQHMRVVASPL